MPFLHIPSSLQALYLPPLYRALCNTETNCWCMEQPALNSKLLDITGFKFWLHHWDLAPPNVYRIDWQWELDRDISEHNAPQNSRMPVFALDDAVLLTTTNGVLKDQYWSVPIWKEKLNPWEQRKQFYKPSCCSGPLETPLGSPACWSVGGNQGTHPAKFISGQATLSSVLITTAIYRLQTKWRSFITWHAPCCWLSISVVGAEQAEQTKAGGRAISLLSLDPHMSPTGHCREELTSLALLKQPHCGLSRWMWAQAAHDALRTQLMWVFSGNRHNPILELFTLKLGELKMHSWLAGICSKR